MILLCSHQGSFVFKKTQLSDLLTKHGCVFCKVSCPTICHNNCSTNNTLPKIIILNSKMCWNVLKFIYLFIYLSIY